MFRHTRTLRRWAARVLLLWLLGLAVPMAHACLGMGSAPAVAAASTAHDRGDCDAQHGSATKTNCQDFCSKASVSLPSQKAALDDLQHLAASAAVTLPPPSPPEVASAHQRVPRLDGVRAPPIPIAYLRLTR